MLRNGREQRGGTAPPRAWPPTVAVCFRKHPVNLAKHCSARRCRKASGMRRLRACWRVSVRLDRLPVPLRCHFVRICSFGACRAFGLAQTLNAPRWPLECNPAQSVRTALSAHLKLSMQCASAGTTHLRRLWGSVSRWVSVPRRPKTWRVVSGADHPDLEASPETAFLDRRFQSYSVFWPARGMRPITPQWDQDGVRRRWDAAALDTREGKVVLGGSEGVRGFVYNVPNPTANANQAYPAICPRCDEDRRRRRLDYPLRVIRTGFQKLGELLSDGLMRHMPQTTARSSASSSSSPTAGKTRPSCPPVCDLALPRCSSPIAHRGPRDRGTWHAGLSRPDRRTTTRPGANAACGTIRGDTPNRSEYPQ